MTPTADSVTIKIDEMLKDDKNFSTRQGVRFMTSILRDALIVIAESSINNNSLDKRLQDVESVLKQFISSQEKRDIQDKEKERINQDERNKWRWAILAPTITLILAEIFRWMTR